METCPICSGACHELKHSMLGYWAGATYSIHWCAECLTRFALPFCPVAGIYETIYRNAGNISGYDRYSKYARLVKWVRRPLDWISRLEEPYAQIRQQIEQLDPTKQKHILEVGCGLGYTTFAFRKAGYNVIGMDISENAIAMARNAYGPYYVAGDAASPRQEWVENFDIIYMSEVIEHLPDPVGFLRSCLDMLRPGGVILVTTPDASQAAAESLWGTDLPPIHFWWFTARSLLAMGAQIGVAAEVIPDSNCSAVEPLKNGAYPQPTFRENWDLNQTPRQMRRMKIERWVPCASWVFVALNRYRDHKQRITAGNSTIIAAYRKPS